MAPQWRPPHALLWLQAELLAAGVTLASMLPVQVHLDVTMLMPGLEAALRRQSPVNRLLGRAAIDAQRKTCGSKTASRLSFSGTNVHVQSKSDARSLNQTLLNCSSKHTEHTACTGFEYTSSTQGTVR